FVDPPEPVSGIQPPSMPQYRIRRMRVEDVPAVLEIWADNDLHEGIDTIQSFMAVDPDGFVVAVEVSDQEDDHVDDDAAGQGTVGMNNIEQSIVFLIDSSIKLNSSFKV